MNNFFKNDVVLIKYPFSDLSTFKIRPAIVINDDFPSQDLIIVPITSKLSDLLPDEFVLSMWKESGLNIRSAVKRGIYTTDEKLVIKAIGHLHKPDIIRLYQSIYNWIGFDN